jgi:tetratricopeptide (TPR) repeat protein
LRHLSTTLGSFIKKYSTLCLFCTVGTYGQSAISTNESLVVLPVVNVSGKTNLDFGRHVIHRLLEADLKEIRRFHIPAESSASFAIRHLRVDLSGHPKPTQLREIGNLLNAHRVVLLSYGYESNQWSFHLQLVETAKSTSATERVVISPRLQDAIVRTRQLVLDWLAIPLTSEDEERLKSRLIESDKALELLGWAILENVNQGPLAEVVKKLRQAALIEPQALQIRQALASALGISGEVDEATALARSITKTRPEYAAAHVTLGNAYRFTGYNRAAQEEWERAHKLDPDTPAPLVLLGTMYADQDRWQEAARNFEEASRIAPHDPTVWIGLARANAFFGKFNLALTQLENARRYEYDDPVVAYSIGEVCFLLGDFPSSRESYERALTMASSSGIAGDWVSRVSKALTECDARLTRNLVHAAKPKIYSSEELTDAVRERIRRVDQRQIILPFASNQKINEWSDFLIGDSIEPAEKAKRLFDGINRGVRNYSRIAERTVERPAIEAYEVWLRPGADLTCQDFAFLYMAMARHAGLPAFYVWVVRDFKSRYVSHACVGIFVDGGALLVDPAYRWFGIPHKEFKFLDDLQVTGHYLACRPEPAFEDIGLSFCGNWSVPYFRVTLNRLADHRFKEASAILHEGLRIESMSWWAQLAQGAVAVSDKQWTMAIQHLESCISLKPDIASAYYYLGLAYQHTGNFIKARENLQSCLQRDSTKEFEARAKLEIARINQVVVELK